MPVREARATSFALPCPGGSVPFKRPLARAQADWFRRSLAGSPVADPFASQASDSKFGMLDPVIAGICGSGERADGIRHIVIPGAALMDAPLPPGRLPDLC